MDKFTGEEKINAVKTYLNRAVGHKTIPALSNGERLPSRGFVQSMSRKGNYYDNSVMENFFEIMKAKFLYLKEFESVEQF